MALKRPRSRDFIYRLVVVNVAPQSYKNEGVRQLLFGRVYRASGRPSDTARGGKKRGPLALTAVSFCFMFFCRER